MSIAPASPRSRWRAPALFAASLLVLTGCSGEKGISEDKDPSEVMSLAKEKLDTTDGVALKLTSKDLPEGTAALSSAEGVGTHAPAFEGTLNVRVAGNDAKAPVIAVDDKVWVKFALLGPGWNEITPSDYGAPDPAKLMDTEKGFSSLLEDTEDPKAGETVRGGENNDEVLTEYTGSVPAETMANFIPSSQGDFSATYQITDKGELREADLTGDFYAKGSKTTYTIVFSDYGTGKDITAP